MSKPKNNLKKISLVLIILGIVVILAGSGLYVYANSQLSTLANEIQVNNSYWTYESCFLFARQNNPSLASELDASVPIIIVGGIIIALAIGLIVSKKLFIKAVDDRIKEAENK